MADIRIIAPKAYEGFEKKLDLEALAAELPVSESSDIVIFPGFCDVHVHFREPGFSYKETMESGTKAAAAGGYTAVCPMPNLKPVPDSPEHLKEELDIIERDAVINVYPYGSITVNEDGMELADLEGMAGQVCAFSDDGHGVQSEELMKDAMKRIKALGSLCVAHCEVNSESGNGYIHEGEYAKAHGHRTINSASEWMEVERDIRLSEETGCPFHACHMSVKESVELIRQAKARGLDISGETAPHYLLLDESDLKEDGKWKMNPPLRSAEDKAAMIRAVQDGTIEIIATDHAPHSAEEKSRGLEKSAFGIVGIETCFPLLYTGLVEKGIISLEQLVSMLTVNPRKRFSLPEEDIMNGLDYTVWDLNAEYKIDPNDFLSKGKATPFEGQTVKGRCLKTVCRGKTVYEYK
jgi:dihydroorotase